MVSMFSMLGRYLVRRSPFLFFKTCILCWKLLFLRYRSHRFLLPSELIRYIRACATWGSLECTDTKCRDNLSKSASQNLQECFLFHCLFLHSTLISLSTFENYCHCQKNKEPVPQELDSLFDLALLKPRLVFVLSMLLLHTS